MSKKKLTVEPEFLVDFLQGFSRDSYNDPAVETTVQHIIDGTLELWKAVLINGFRLK